VLNPFQTIFDSAAGNTEFIVRANPAVG